MIGDITVEEALSLEQPLFVDVRSPSEYKEATIPGAVNIPFFYDAERAEIGRIYREESPCRARERGLEMVAPRLPQLVNEVERLCELGQVVLFCWRGGERSQALASVFQLLRVPCYRLDGGYRAYRRHVVQQLELLPRGEVVVLHGLTGCGKTELIKGLRERGYASVDLEGLACHRGSVFGGMGMGEQPGQKMFDSRLWQELKMLESYPYLVVECESRRIGRVYLPSHLFSKMSQGRHILVYDSLENRINRLVQEYVAGDTETVVQELKEGLDALERFIGSKRVKYLMDELERRDFEKVVEYLLLNYYDSLYRYPSGPDSRFELCVSAGDLGQAITEVGEYLERQYDAKG